MTLTETTASLQREFATVVRTGGTNTLPGTHSDERVATYARLVHSIFCRSLSRAYPLTKRFLSHDKWDKLTQRFIAEHNHSSPLFWKMPYELYEFVCASDVEQQFDCPWLSELLLLEWIEIQVRMMPDEEVTRYETLPNNFWETLQSTPVVLNPHFEIIRLTTPLFKFPPLEAATKQGEYYLACFRHLENFEVKFLCLSPFLAQLLLSLKERPQLVPALLRDLCSQATIELTEQMEQMTRDFFGVAYRKGLLLGKLSSF